jgi:hypothetical protein
MIVLGIVLLTKHGTQALKSAKSAANLQKPLAPLRFDAIKPAFRDSLAKGYASAV